MTGSGAAFTTSAMKVTGWGDLTELFKAGDGVTISGCTTQTANNKDIIIKAVTADTITVADNTFTEATETGTAVKIQRRIPDMDFICESDGALMCYVTNSPQIDEPSAGYIFTWDMLGNGSYMATDQFDGEGGTHSEFVEGLMSTDMRKTCDDLACYMSKCV